jgi:hypothetical protein
VREALEILSNDGLLSHGLNQVYFVAKFSADEMNQLYTMRHLLEREAIATIAWPEITRRAGSGVTPSKVLLVAVDIVLVDLVTLAGLVARALCRRLWD